MFIFVLAVCVCGRGSHSEEVQRDSRQAQRRGKTDHAGKRGNVNNNQKVLPFCGGGSVCTRTTAGPGVPLPGLSHSHGRLHFIRGKTLQDYFI